MIEKLTKEYDVICIMEMGESQYRGIYIPTDEQILLQKIPSQINNDLVILFPLCKFIDSCIDKEEFAMSMLAKENPIYKNGTLWDFIQDNQKKFYSKDAKKFCNKILLDIYRNKVYIG